MKVLHKNGVCTEKMHSYDITKFNKCPNKKSYINALKHKISKYITVGTTINEFKTALGLGYPIVFGFIVKESFEKVDNTGILIYDPDEKELGGHAVICCGYDDNLDNKGGHIKIANSWGTSFGKDGYFYMSYTYLESGLCSDAWILMKRPDDF